LKHANIGWKLAFIPKKQRTKLRYPYAGWVMRIEFVLYAELYRRPMHEVLRNASKNHIRRPNRGGSSRTGFCDRLEHGGYVPKSRKAEDGRIDDRYNLVELSTSSYPARTRRNIEESDGTVIFRVAELSAS